MERERVAAIAATKGVIIRKEAMTPHRWSRAGAAGHGVKSDVAISPYLLKFRSKEIAVGTMIVKIASIQRSIRYVTNMPVIERNSSRRYPFAITRVMENLSRTIVTGRKESSDSIAAIEPSMDRRPSHHA